MRPVPPNRRKSRAPIDTASTRAAPVITRYSVCMPVAGVDPGSSAGRAADADGRVGVADAAGEVAAVVAAGVATGEAAGVLALLRLVMMLAWQVTVDPPTFPVPLHWVTLIGIARLTLDRGSTVQCTVPPPPLAEPLHWVTVATVVAAGNGSHRGLAVAAEPTHWLDFALSGARREACPS